MEQLSRKQNKNLPAKFVEPEVPAVAPVKLTDDEVKQAAERLGMTQFKPAGYRDMIALGQFMEQEGAVKIAVGKYMLNDSVRERTVAVMQNCIDNLPPNTDPEKIAKLVSAMNQLLTSSDRNMKEVLSAAKLGMLKRESTKPKNPLPPKGTVIIARDVHVQSDSKVSDIEKAE